MKKMWHEKAWEHYLYWQTHDRKILQKINELLKDTCRTPFSGIGKPEPLKGNLGGCWSRHITEEHRLVYRVKDDALEIVSCKNHYGD